VALALTLTVFPERLQKEVDSKIRGFYVPDSSGGMDKWVNSEKSGIREYVTYLMYDIENADDVLFNRSEPVLKRKGPFLYEIKRKKLIVNRKDGSIEYRNRRYAETIMGYVEMNGGDGKLRVSRGVSPDHETLRMVNVPFLSVLNHALANPFNLTAITEFQDQCADAFQKPPKTLSDILFCLDYVLQERTHGEVSLNSTMGSITDSLFPRLTATQWLGLEPTKMAPNAIWKAFTEVILGWGKTDTSWAFFANSTQASDDIANALLKSQKMSFSRDHMPTAMTYEEWSQLTKLQKESNTHGDHPSWNQLSYHKPFAGWVQDIPIDGMGYITDEVTHPDLSSKKHPKLNMWLPQFARPMEFSFLMKDSSQGVEYLRYQLSQSNFDRNQVYYSSENGLFNISQLSNYAPVMVSTPHFYGFPLVASKAVCCVGNPDPSFDMSSIDVEPNSGVVINSNLGYQMNVQMPELDFNFTSLNYTFSGKGGATEPKLYPSVITYNYRQGDKIMSEMLDIQDLPNKQAAFRTWGAVGAGIGLLVGFTVFMRGIKWKKKRSKRKRTTYGATPSLLYDSSRA